MKFGRAIKVIRVKFGLNQRELADAADISAAAVNMIEKGLREPSMVTLKKICDYFDIPVSLLIYEALKLDEEVEIEPSNKTKVHLDSMIGEYIESRKAQMKAGNKKLVAS